MAKRVGGRIFLKADGIQFDAKGQFTYNLGEDQREEVMGHDGLHGVKAIPQPARLEGEITDNFDLDLKNDLLNITDATITLELYNGKTVSFPNAAYTGTGDVQTEEGNVAVKFVSDTAEEI